MTSDLIDGVFADAGFWYFTGETVEVDAVCGSVLAAAEANALHAQRRIVRVSGS